MKMLLDTHILLWALFEDDKLGRNSRTLISDMDNVVYYSAASIWEIAIKHRKYPERIPFGADDIIRYCDDAGYFCLNITSVHVAETANLRLREGTTVNNDPFDRMLIAQAKTEGMPLITRDKVMQYYDEPCIMMD